MSEAAVNLLKVKIGLRYCIIVQMVRLADCVATSKAGRNLASRQPYSPNSVEKICYLGCMACLCP